MNKICTSIEQSKKLIELGIDVNTADMCWTNHLFNAFLSSWRIESTPPQEYKNLLDRFVVRGYLIEPAWSLSALFDLFPNGSILRKSDKGKYFMFGNMFDNPLDAAFEMICWLLENKKI